MKKIIFCFLLFLLNINIFGVEYNINDLFQINIPNEIEVVSINQRLRIKNDNSQYYIVNNIFFIYENKYFVISINCYGNSNSNILNGIDTLNMNTGIYYSNYNIADQIKYLIPNYNEIPIYNNNNIKYSKFVSYWPSGVTSDYYGLYFQIPNDDFSECIISINNIWGSFGDIRNLILGNNHDYREKYILEGGNLKDLFELLAIMENSITFNISNNAIKITNGFSYEKYETDYSYIISTIDNARMRNEPFLEGEILGNMENKLYQIIIIGDEIEIDGIIGNWLLIKPASIGNSLSWVFSEHTRQATEEEINYYLYY